MRKLRLVFGLAAVATFASGAFFTTNAVLGVAPAPNAEQALIVTPWKDATCDSDQFLAFKVEPVANGPAGPNGEVIISNVDGDSFDWAIAPGFLQSLDIASVIVKGGPNSAIVYVYGDTTDDSDTELQAPLNKDKPYGVSHIEFCFDKKG